MAQRQDGRRAPSRTDIVTELSLPPVKIHCSVLAEDAIKAAIGLPEEEGRTSEKNVDTHAQ
jgi:nitrogen fixation NifU-like protein